jgi:cytochrome c biogenesis protein CcdA
MKILNTLIKLFGMAMTLIYVVVGIFVLFLKDDVVFYSTGTFTDTIRYNLFHFHIIIGTALVIYGLFRVIRLYIEFKKEREKSVENEN